MTEERRYGINWVDLIIKIILLILFVLLICWLFPMPKLDTFYDKVFNENIQTMKYAARDYYTSNNLPTTIGETKSMTLKQLVDNKLVLEFSDKDGNACDTTNSYVQVTKTLDSEYALKVQLTCGEQSDYIIDTIGCNGTCLLSDVKNASNNEKADDEDYKPTSTSKGSTKNYVNSNGGGTSTVYYPLGGNNTPSKSTTTTIIKNPTTSNNNSNNGGNSNNTNNNGSSNSTNNKRTLYYEHARIVEDYGNWIEGYRTGSNIETKTESVRYYNYTNSNYANSSSVYRTSSWIDRNEIYNGKTYSYELQLTDLPSSTRNVNIITDRYFNSSDYQSYINNMNKNIYMTGNDMLHNSNNRNATAFKNSALRSNNFTYTLSDPYKSNGVWRVLVTIRIKNSIGIMSYYDSSLNKNIFFVPVYFKAQYNGGNSKTYTDTSSNAYKYPGYSKTYAYTTTKKYYRYVNEYVDYHQTKWSTSRNLSGYKFTGNTQYR